MPGSGGSGVKAAYVHRPVCVVQILPIACHGERILEPFKNLASARLSRVQAFCPMGACVANTSWSLFMQEMGPLCQKTRV